MTSLSIAKAVARALFNAGTLAEVTAAEAALSEAVRFYAHDCEVTADGETAKVGEIKLPHIAIDVTTEALNGNPSAATATVTIHIETQADDGNGTIHAQREAAVQTVMSNEAWLATWFASVGGITLLGPAAQTANAPGVEAAAYSTPLTYLLGVAAE